MASAPISPQIPSAGTAVGLPLQTQLQKLARRRNSQLLIRSLVRSSLWGVGAATLAVLAYKTHLIADGPLWAPAALIGASVLVGLRNGLIHRSGEFTAAREADETLELEDQLSSALAFVAPQSLTRREVVAPRTALDKTRHFLWPSTKVTTSSTAPLQTNLVPALVDEAQTRALQINPKQIYPAQFDKRAGMLCALTVAFIAACCAPDYPVFLSKQEKTERAAIVKEGEKLIQVTKNIRQEAPPLAQAEKELNQKLEKLGQKMARGRITKRAALGEMGTLKKELQKAQAQSKNGQNGELPQIAEALRDAPLQSQTGRKIQQEVTQNNLNDAAKQLEDLAQKLENGQLSEQEKQQAANDLDKVAKELRQRGGQANQQAAKQLEDAANALRQQNQQGQQQNPQQNQNQAANNTQQQQGQNGQQGQNQPGQQGNQQQQQSGQNQQGQKGQQGQQQPQSGQNGQQQQNQNGQNQQGNQQQSGQQNQQGNSQQNQQGNSQQNQSGSSQQNGQQGQSQQNQSGNQGNQPSPGNSGQPQQGQNGQSPNGASNALRDMANNLRQGNGNSSGNGQNLQNMLNKLREAENGTNGGEQSGLGQSSQSGKNGQQGQSGQQGDKGQSQGATPGKDLQPTDGRGNNGGGPGLGPRDQSTGNKGTGTSNIKSKRTGDKRRYSDVWSDRLPKTKSKVDQIKGKWGGEGEVEQLPTRGEAKGGEARTPYYEVYESYKKDAEDAVSREAVPPAYKQPVKDYFESLKP